MRIKCYDGTVKEIRSVKPIVEKRFRFNGRIVRMAETACSAKEDATGLYFEFGMEQSGWMHPCETAFMVGNLPPRVVKDALNTLLTKEYIDISQWDYQSNRDVFLGHEGTVFDEGETKPYISAGMVVNMQSPFTGVPIQGEDFVNTHNCDDIEYELENMRSAIFKREDCKYSISELAEMSEEDLREIYAMVNGEE